MNNPMNQMNNMNNMNNPMGQMNQMNNMNNPMGQMNINNMNNPMGQMNMNNNTDTMQFFCQIYNQMMQNMQNMQDLLNMQNMQNNPNMTICNNPGGNNEIRDAKDNGYDPFLGNSNIRFNIFFELQTGKRIPVLSPTNITVFQLLDGFFKKSGILNEELQKKVNFLFNGRSLLRILPNGQKNNTIISNIGIIDNTKVLVTDTQNILGA